MTRPLAVNEIYSAIQGEGLFVGVPTVFLRFQGCSLSCGYCDTKYAIPFYKEGETEGFLRSEDALIEECKKFNCKNFCLTGGDPLNQKHSDLVPFLIRLRKELDAHIVIETGGHVPIGEILDQLRFADVESLVHFCVDYKLSCSGMKDRMKDGAFFPLRSTDSIKYVCASDKDFIEAIAHLTRMRSEEVLATALFSPAWGDPGWTTRLAELVRDLPISHVRFSLQIHKVLYDPVTRCV